MNNLTYNLLETILSENYNIISYSLGRRSGNSYIKYYISTYYELFKRLKRKQKINKLKLKKRHRKGLK